MSSISEPESVDKKELLRQSIKGEWEEVVKKYEEKAIVRRAKITESGNTVLHIAVSQYKGRIVEELVRIITEKGEAKEVLEIKNKRGNTPLHLAAASTWLSEQMCDCIAKVDASLVGDQNEDNETPLLLAALHGNKEAFFCLHKYIPADTEERYDYCRRKDGDTILHCAIDGYHFDLAFQIIHWYPDLVNSVNKRGFSPLHHLASKPDAFRSGTDLGIWSKIIYYCMGVPKFKQSSVQGSSSLPVTTKKEEKNYGNEADVENPQGVLRLGPSSLPVTTKKEEKNDGNEVDVENPQGVLQLGPSSLPVTTKKEEKNDGNEADVENPQGMLQLGPSSLPVTTKKDEKKDGKEADAENPQAGAGFLRTFRSWIVGLLRALLWILMALLGLLLALLFIIFVLFEMVILRLG